MKNLLILSLMILSVWLGITNRQQTVALDEANAKIETLIKAAEARAANRDRDLVHPNQAPGASNDQRSWLQDRAAERSNKLDSKTKLR